jgi:hypothetical protein
MSLYRSLVVDYPTRVLEAWQDCLPNAATNGREVSLTLACLGASVGTVLELLGRVGSGSDDTRNPMAEIKINKEYGPKNLSEIDTIRASLFVGSKIGPGSNSSWRYGPRSAWLDRLQLNTDLANIDQWPDLNTSSPDLSKVSCADVLTVLRHASAHGGIYVRGKAKKIDQVVMVNINPGKGKNHGKYSYSWVAASPAGLILFAEKWKDVVASLVPPPTTTI